jgi:iron complex transport system substrate-binding protein
MHPSPFRRAPWWVALVVAVAACAPAATSAPPSTGPTVGPTPTAVASQGPQSLVDDEGTTVVIGSTPGRIASLTPAATEILFAIGAGAHVVAKAEDITPYPPEADRLPVVATIGGIDVEQIVSLGVDLVIAGGSGFTPPDAVTQLRGLGIAVVVVYAADVEGALHDIELIGDAAGAGDAAAELTASMRARFDELGALTAGQSKPRVFYEIDASNAIYTPAEDSVYTEMLRLAGADPITTDASYVISLERLVAADPEIILLGDAASGVSADQVASRPGWGALTAVKNGAIVPVDDVIVTRPGPRLVDGLRALIAAIHPDVALPSG